MVCLDSVSSNGGLWLDPQGRSCQFYEFTYSNGTCDEDACCICRESVVAGEADEDVWAIVLVAFCLLLTCMLSFSFYFVCHLYRNEKRKNARAMQSTAQRMAASHTVSSKSDLSKADLQIEDEYAAIPGDIGVGARKKVNGYDDSNRYGNDADDNDDAGNKADDDDVHDDDYDPEDYADYQQRPSQATTYKIRASFRSKANSNETILSVADEYAVIDDLGKKSRKALLSKHKASETGTPVSMTPVKTVKLKPGKRPFVQHDALDYKSQKAYKQSIHRRYSAELEFNHGGSGRSSSSSKRTRTSSRFQHSYRQTQDDMIFLSFEQYLEQNDEAEAEDDDDDDDEDDNAAEDDTIATTMTAKERFSRVSTRRVIKLFEPQEILYKDIDFSNQQFIGKGSFGVVVRAKYHEIDVAVKKLHAQRLSGSELVNFKREAAIMQKVGGHKHIARMYGFCTKPEICIVTEYYGRGSLHDLIVSKKKDKSKRRITTQLKLQMCVEASLGIWHLHQQQVIHRDISARNLLVDDNWTVVVADLGMSRFKTRQKENKKKTSNVGAVKWMAPESIIGNDYSEKSDSYSFGIALYEIFSESEPYPGLLPLEAGAKVVHEGLRPSVDKNKKISNVPNLIKLLAMLWKPQPKDRPDFLFITQSLKKIKKQWLLKKEKYKKHK